MAEPLSGLVAQAVYLDATALIGLLDRKASFHSTCAAFFQQAINREPPVGLVTSVLTLDEVAFVLLQELVARPPYDIRSSRSQYLNSHREVVKSLMVQVGPLLEQLTILVDLEPVTPADAVLMGQLMSAEGLLPRDALHLATIRRLGLGAVASADHDFDGHAGLTRYDPAVTV